MGWDIARSRYCTTSFVKSLYADFLKGDLFNSRLFNAPKAKKRELSYFERGKKVSCMQF